MPAAFLPKLDSSDVQRPALDDVWSATDTSQRLVVGLQSNKPKALLTPVWRWVMTFASCTAPHSGKVHPQHVAGDRGSQPPNKQLRGQGLRIRGRDRAAPALLVRELYAQGPPVEFRPGHGQRFDSCVARTKLDERIGRGALSTDKADVGDGAEVGEDAPQHVAVDGGAQVGDVDRGHFFGSTVYWCCGGALAVLLLLAR